MTEAAAHFRPDFSHCRVTVMGLGRSGGGVGAVRFLQQRGAAVTVTDLLSEDELQDSLQEIDVGRLEALHLGGHCEKDFLAADLVVVNPAVRRDHPLLQLARGAGVPLSSEMNLFWQFRRGPVIGVTGSNGKSTTAGLIHSVLKAAGRTSHLGGNIGRSLLPQVEDIGPDDWTVLELSSFQLQDLDRLPSSPEIAVVTNFAPNHLDWHGCLEDYRRAKQAVLRWQSPHDVCVLNADDPDVSTWCRNGRCFYFGSEKGDATLFSAARDGRPGAPGVFRRGDSLLLRGECGGETVLPVWTELPLPGEHNLSNAQAAAAVGLALRLPFDAIERGLRSFEPLPHRLQFVGEWEGRRFYNDSKATTPESVFAALESFDEPIVLLAGGYDKGVDLSGLADRVAKRAKAAALMGGVAGLLNEMIAGGQPPAASQNAGAGPVVGACADFDESFRWAVGQSAPGDVVLLSPGCASFGWFSNYAERGERFVELFRRLKTG